MNQLYQFLSKMIQLIKWIWEKIAIRIIKRVGVEQLIQTRFYIAENKNREHIPSDCSYTKEHPISFFIQNDCVNAHFFVDDKRVFIIKNIKKFQFLKCVFLNAVCKNSVSFFKLTPEQKNELSLNHSKISECPPKVNVKEQYLRIKQHYNSRIDYFPEKEYIDKFCEEFNIELNDKV